MSSGAPENNKRRHRRTVVSRPVRARVDSREQHGQLRDISAGGASVEMEFEDDVDVDAEADLYIDDISDLSGRVARTFDDGMAVQFDLDSEDEDRLLDEIASMGGKIQVEDI